MEHRALITITTFVLALAIYPRPLHAKPIEGFTQPFETVNLAAPEAGIVQGLQVRPGQTVKAKQSIATLDNQVFFASLESARAKADSRGRVQAAEAVFNQKESRLSHMRQLRKAGHGSPEEVERAATDADIAKANLVTAREDAIANALEVKRIEAQIERRTIRSPVRGVISHVAKRPGEFVTATDPTIATVVQIDKLRVIFHVPTERVARLHVSDKVKVRFTLDGSETESTVDFISPITNAESNLVRVEVIIDNSLRQFRSGVRCIMIERPPNRQDLTDRGIKNKPKVGAPDNSLPRL